MTSDRYVIRHRSGWIGSYTWSVDRAKSWLAEFDPKEYVDKTLKVEDFFIFDQITGAEET